MILSPREVERAHDRGVGFGRKGPKSGIWHPPTCKSFGPLPPSINTILLGFWLACMELTRSSVDQGLRCVAFMVMWYLYEYSRHKAGSYAACIIPLSSYIHLWSILSQASLSLGMLGFAQFSLGAPVSKCHVCYLPS